MQRLITLTTDFGTQDHYVGTMKGVILSINPAAQIVDLCHGVPAYDVLDGALTIAQAYSYFPSNSVHVVVVDPGVGTIRRPIVADTGRHLFIAPDNGVLSFVYEREEHVVVRHLTAEHYFQHPVSPTFHGRDIFAPVAAYISKGTDPAVFGEVVGDQMRFTVRPLKTEGDHLVRGVVLKVDKFGNLITNIRPSDVPQLFVSSPLPFQIVVGKGEIRSIKPVFAEGAPGEAFAVLGSMGFLEIAVNQGSAAETLAAGKNSEVTVVFGE
jgi:hypothetical protein